MRIWQYCDWKVPATFTCAGHRRVICKAECDECDEAEQPVSIAGISKISVSWCTGSDKFHSED
jgi:hypothetical protein